MARNKVLKVPKPPKQYNNRGYEYPEWLLRSPGFSV